jgi:hypothetical protein
MGWSLAYAYTVLCIGCAASYLGAPPTLIIVTSSLLALPFLVKARKDTSPIEIAAQVAAALIFALLAHTVGWGIAGALGT